MNYQALKFSWILDKCGTIAINNIIISDQEIKRISGYLYQDCIFMESLTVIEHMEFMAALKLPSLGTACRKEIYTTLLQDLSLINCSRSLLKVLSGGEKKRLALAVEVNKK